MGIHLQWPAGEITLWSGACLSVPEKAPAQSGHGCNESILKVTPRLLILVTSKGSYAQKVSSTRRCCQSPVLWDWSPFPRNRRLEWEAEKTTTVIGVFMLQKCDSSVWVSWGCYNKGPHAGMYFLMALETSSLRCRCGEAGSP